MRMRSFLLAVGIYLCLAMPWHAGGVAHAQAPTPTPFPTPAYTGVPTQTMVYTSADPGEVYNLIPITHSQGLTLTLDIGLWDWNSFVTIFRTANTVKHLANQYHVFDILFAFALAGLVLAPIVVFIRARGQGGGDS